MAPLWWAAHLKLFLKQSCAARAGLLHALGCLACQVKINLNWSKGNVRIRLESPEVGHGPLVASLLLVAVLLVASCYYW